MSNLPGITRYLFELSNPLRFHMVVLCSVVTARLRCFPCDVSVERPTSFRTLLAIVIDESYVAGGGHLFTKPVEIWLAKD